jgi:Holliday junction resolvase RusA-like endonuclease
MGPHWECPHCGHKGLTFVKNENYADTDQKNYERFGAMCAQQGMVGSEKFVGPSQVTCTFLFGIPKTGANSKKKEGDWHTQRPDVDNCKKSVLDFCNALVWADDCIIARIVGEKRWTLGVPQTLVTVESLESLA